MAAERSGIERLLRPRSIAVIGGGSWGANVVAACRQMGFSGQIWPVHPTRDTLAGLPVFPSPQALPGVPDASFIAVNAEQTIDTLRQLAARGAGGAICFASGFQEVEDGAARQTALKKAAAGMTILGPNCYGFLNYLDGVALWPDTHGGKRVERGVAIVAQSSNIALNLTMQTRGLPLAHVATVGNQAQTGLSTLSIALLEDPRVTALGLYIEGIDDLRGFEALAATARRLRKPIVALKVGRTEQAQAAALTHTASLTGSDAGARALLRRLGIGQVFSLPVLLEALKLLHIAGPLPSNRLASLSCSGGEASLMADTAQGHALEFPALTPSQERVLRDILGPRVTLANPLDYHTYIWGDEDALAGVFTAAMQADVALGCVILDLPRADRCDPAAWAPVIAAVARAKAATGRAMAIVSSLPETLPEAVAEDLSAKGIVPLAGLADALAAIEVAAMLGQPPPRAAPLLLPPEAREGRVLTEAEAKAVLAAAGIRVPRAVSVASVDQATAAAAEIGYPVVLKGAGIAHKSEVGAVALNLPDADALRATAASMPGTGFVVEEMVIGTVAELLIGVTSDPAHGYVLTLAAGGVLTEILADSTSRLLPATRAEVAEALQELRIAPVLNGHRGAPAASINAILDTVMALQAVVAETRPQEIEINPLMCSPDGAIAADALLRIGD